MNDGLLGFFKIIIDKEKKHCYNLVRKLNYTIEQDHTDRYFLHKPNCKPLEIKGWATLKEQLEREIRGS
jgi:hypothetical protein